MSFFSACFFPWLDHYRPFLGLVVQHATAPQTSQIISPGSIIRFALNFWSRLLSIPPVTSFLFDASWRRIDAAAQELISNEKFDVLWIENTLSAPFAKRIQFPQIEQTYVICSSQNVESMVSQKLQKCMEQSEHRNYYASQARLMQKMELFAWRKSNLIIQCSETDASFTRLAASNSKVFVVPNGVDTQYFRKSSNSVAPNPTILFTAGFGYHPNIEAVEWFVDNVFPKVLESIPSCTFIFAGSEAVSLQQKLAIKLEAFGDSIQCISDPLDIRPCFEKAWVYVVPLQYGGGTRLKILEAMAMQLPVVSTTVGAEGVPYINNKHILLADTADEFQKAIVQLLENQDLRNELSAAGLDFVTRNYDWQQIRLQTLQMLRENCQ
jgi:glycosyltransferase involved in cell wall biosynthesis